MPIRIFETGGLLGVALEAARSIKAPPRDGGQKPALISIVFSVVALEAFMNETRELALDSSMCPPNMEPEVVSVFAECMGDAERSSLETKFVLGNWILSGKKLDRSSQPYQDFAALVRLRNLLVHFKANDSFAESATQEEIHKDLFNRFENKHILAENTQFSAGSWTFLIETRAVAEWSCKTAARMVLDFCSRAPQSSFKSALSFFELAFAPNLLSLAFREE